MATHMDSREAVGLPCAVCGADAALLLMGQRYDDPPWGRRMLGLFRSPHVTRVYLCVVCDEVVLVPDHARGRASAYSADVCIC
jgi:hypothetical protein